jgi:hypothetical protein
MKLCRECVHWYYTTLRQGNCDPHHADRDNWSEDADAGDCPEYEDRYEKYRTKEEALCQQQ